MQSKDPTHGHEVNLGSPLSISAGLTPTTPGQATTASRLTTLQSLACEFGNVRGQLRALPVCPLAELNEVDRHFGALVKESLRSCDPGSIAILRSLALRIQDETRLNCIEEHIKRLSNDIGMLWDLRSAQSRLTDFGDQRKSYLATQEDLILKYSGLPEALKETAKQSESAGFEARLEIEAVAINLHRLIKKLWGQFDDVFKLIAPLSHEQKWILVMVYEQRYGDNLASSFARFKGVQGQCLQNLLLDKLAPAWSDYLALKLDSRGPYWAKNVTATIKIIPPNILTEVRADFNTRYARRFGAESLESIIYKNTKGTDRAYLNELLKQEPDRADAVLLRESIKSRSGGKIVVALLEARVGSALERFKEAFLQVNLDSLESYIRSNMPPGLHKDRALAYLAKDVDRHRAFKLACALKERDGLSMEEVFLGNGKEAREKFISDYNRIIGQDFWKALRKMTGCRCFPLACSFIDNGKLSRAEGIWFFMLGFGRTDEAGILRILSGLNKSEIAELRDDYSTRYRYRRGKPRSLVRDLKKEMKADSMFEARQLLAGKPDTPAKLLALLKRRYRHEKSGILIERGGWFARERSLIERHLKNVSEYYENVIRKRPYTESQAQEFERRVKLAKVDLGSFRLVKAEKAKIIANLTAAVTGLVVVTAATRGLHWSLWGAIPATAAACLAVRTGLKYAIKGDAYGASEIARDCILAAIDGGTLGIRRIVTGLATYGMMSIATKLGLQRVVAATELLEERKPERPILHISQFAIQASQSTGPELRTRLKKSPLEACHPLDRGLELVFIGPPAPPAPA